MVSLYILVAIILFFVVSLYLSNYLQRKRGNTEERETAMPEIDLRTKKERERDNSGCCGMHETCEKDSLIASFVEPPEYFDDEELDKYRLRDAADYTEQEVDEFREVFYTVLDSEKPRWVRNLQLREIALPNQMKDEVLMLVCEMRKHKMQPHA